MHWQALEGREKVLGPEHPDTLTSVSNLGSVLGSLGKYEEAKAMHQRALEGSEKVLGPEHPNTLTSVSNLGSVLASLGKYEEAEAMHRRALDGYEKVLGPEHPNTLTIMHNLAHTWISQDKVQEALALMGKCVELRNRLLGPDHPDAQSSSRILNTWNGNYSLLPNKQLQNFVLAEYEQIREISTECSPEVVVTHLTDERIGSHQRPEPLTTPVKQFIANHPLRVLITSRTTSSAPHGHDITEVD